MPIKISLIGAGSAVFSLNLMRDLCLTPNLYGSTISFIELKALATGSKELLLQLIMMDPWTRSEDQARSLMEEILALPYHEEMRKHYK